jgi:osmotically-inducible protein OsmY
MNISWKKRILVVCAYLAPAVSGFGGFATRAEAQNAASALSRSASIAASTTQGADWIADEELRKRVKAALHNDPHFYDDEYVTVSVEKGVVILGGFVLSDWDLRDAIQTARKAAGDRQVIDNLAIKQGGRQ